MSTDRLALIALEQRVKADIFYFELVELIYSDPELRKRLYVCVGKHVLCFVNRNLSGPWPPPGDFGDAAKIPYGHVARTVEDVNSFYNLAIDLNESANPFWAPGRLVLAAEHRSRLLVHLRTAWQTEVLWRLGQVKKMPCFTEELGDMRTGEPRLTVQPFEGYQVVFQDGYSFFVPKDFETKKMHSASTGTYSNNKYTCTVQIQDPRSLDSLAADYSDHIRWVAVRQRQTMATGDGVLIVKNGFYLKKMNLVNDIASWTGWMTFLKSDTEVKVMMFLRRQFIPPLADTAQDIFVTVSCPKHVLDDHKGAAEAVTDETLLTIAGVAADSLSPVAQRCTVPQTFYRDMIQAKLDALLFGEESLFWLRGSLGLSPDQKLQDWARCFVKSILKMLQEESALESPTLLKTIGEDVATEKDPMAFPRNMMLSRFPGNVPPDDPAANAFYARVARYLAHSVDGGILGPRLSLMDLTSNWIPTARIQAKIDEIIMFFLHIRPMDMTKKWEHKPVRLLLHDADLFETNSFNDRVMQSVVELGWIEEAISRDKRDDKRDEQRGRKTGAPAKLSLEYSKFLASVLMCKASSINLKAAVCRQLNKSGASEHFGVLCPALLQTVRHTSIFLRTNATLCLINISAEHRVVSDLIIKSGIIPYCNHNLKSYDDDLTRYTLVLLTHLTKNVAILKDLHPQVTQTLVMLLEKTPALPSKQSLLADLASVIGQVCNNDEIWKSMCEDMAKPMEKLVTLFKGAPPGGQLRCKVMFALRIFVSRPTEHELAKREHLSSLVKLIADDMQAMCPPSGANGTATLQPDDDYLANAILLLGTLCKSSKIAEEAAKKDKDSKRDLVETLSALTLQSIGSKDSTRDRLRNLLARLEHIQKSSGTARAKS
mmetsp:Transcript_35864/g.103280  ORF Transcript_35864/g.103280 Transcript_35864/m.103280 type:complete len:883 (-) Transcript_35864:99-2747(-)